MKSNLSATFLHSRFAKILAITLSSLLFLSALSLTCGFSKQAFAAQKTDTISGKITMTLDNSPAPSQPGGGKTEGSGVDKTGTETSSSGSQSGTVNGATDNKATTEQGQATEQKSFKKVLASTGDYIPFALVSLLIVGSAFAAIVYIARRESNGKLMVAQNLSNLSIGKKVLIVVLSTLVVSGSAFAVKQAIAGETSDYSASNNRFARITGDIRVNDKGEIKSASLDLDNRCKSQITIKSIYSNGEFAELINGQIQSGDTIDPDDIHHREWRPNVGKVNPLLLAKLRQNSGKLTEDINADLMRNAYSVKFFIGDPDKTLHEEQTVYENETAVYPANKPTRMNYYFDEFYTQPDRKGERADANYIYTHPVTSDMTYDAGWDYYEPFNWFMIKKNADPNHINVFDDEAVKSEEFIPIEKIREAAYYIKMGKNPRPDVFNDQNDEWHMFSRSTITPNRVNRWTEMRIVHIGDHDGDRTGITFQSIHGSLARYHYDTTYKEGITDKKSTSYTDSNIRSLINDVASGTTFDQLSRVVGTIPKKTIAGDFSAKKDGGVGTTYDRFWIPSFTEMVSGASVKASIYRTDDLEGSTYNFWKSKNLLPRVGGKSPKLSALQLKYLIPLTRNRQSAYDNNDGGEPRNMWLRSISPTDGGKVLRVTNKGEIEADEGGLMNTSNAISICWAI